MLIRAIALAPGVAEAELAVLEAPLSLWGGVSLETGAIIDRTHPQHGLPLAGRVVAMRGGRGSSSSSSALVELARCGRAPAAILLIAHDPILTMGALVAAELYAVRVPILRLEASDWDRLITGARVRVRADNPSRTAVLAL